ncbi:MAG TPA: hypothetical protein VGH46_07120 [Gaiellaceae bacterium]|jgi:hypothetical protein
MGSRSAIELLQLPVRLRGIRLGRPVDLLLDADEWRALGFVVLCGDESLRFLVFATADVEADAIEVPSALLLFEDLDFYRERSRSLRGLLGGDVVTGPEALGKLHDLTLAPGGVVETLVVADADIVRDVHPDGLSVMAAQVSPARG